MTKAKGIPLAARVGGVANSRVRLATPKHPPSGKPGGSILSYLESSPYDENSPIGISRGGCFKYKHYVLRTPLFIAVCPLVTDSLKI